VSTETKEDHYQKGRQIGPGRFIPTPSDVIKAMLEAALKLIDPADAPAPTKRASVIVEAPPPKRRW
jgi:hypothetical protein